MYEKEYTEDKWLKDGQSGREGVELGAVERKLLRLEK